MHRCPLLAPGLVTRVVRVFEELHVAVHAMVKMERHQILIVFLDRLPQFLDVAPASKMLLFSRLADDFTADLTLGRVAVACDGVCGQIFLHDLTFAVRAGD